MSQKLGLQSIYETMRHFSSLDYERQLHLLLSSSLIFSQTTQFIYALKKIAEPRSNSSPITILLQGLVWIQIDLDHQKEKRQIEFHIRSSIIKHQPSTLDFQLSRIKFKKIYIPSYKIGPLSYNLITCLS